ncbi:MAG: YjbQ family protein [Chitinivibrionales bacterium]|nr:YjbQ family protein [Chitinivibrionales bacterium]
MVTHTEVSVKTQQRNQMKDITSHVQDAVGNSKISDGICTVSSMHTTAGVTINENADPDVVRDILWKLGSLVPVEREFHHREGNSDSHIKTSLTGLSVQVPVKNGKLILGTWQSIYFCEFDGARSRRVMVTCMGE